MAVKRVGIIGAGRFGAVLAEELSRGGMDVLLVERNRETVQRSAELVGHVVHGDGTDERVLLDCGFETCDAAVVAVADDMEASILAAMNVLALKIPYVVAKAASDMHGKVLERLGVSLVVYPDRERAIRLARSLFFPSYLDYFEIANGVSIVELAAPESWIGRSLVDAKIRTEHNLTVLAIKRAPDKKGNVKSIVNPQADDLIEAGDTLILFGNDKKLKALTSGRNAVTTPLG